MKCSVSVWHGGGWVSWEGVTADKKRVIREEVTRRMMDGVRQTSQILTKKK